MSTIFRTTDHFDILFNNLLRGSGYQPFTSDVKPGFPVDIYITDEFLTFEIPLAGADIEGLSINKTNDELRVSYHPKKDEKQRTWIHKGIAKRDFEFAWRISPKFDLSKLSNTYSAGLLSIFIPWNKEALPQSVPVLNLDKNREKVLNEQNLD